jgi:hypothetical protein
VQAPAADESDRNNNEDQMDDMIVDIGMKYDLGSEDQHPTPEVQNSTSDENVCNGTDLTVLQGVTCFMEMKSKYNFSNQCYNDIMMLIIDPIPMKHNMPKDLYQSKKIVASLGVNYEKIDVYEKNCMLFWKKHKDDTEYMHCSRSRYVKVVNKDGAFVTTKVAVKQLCYMPFTPRLKQLYLSEETMK